MGFKKIWNILFRSDHPDYEWLQRLFFISLILIMVMIFKYYLPLSIKKSLFPLNLLFDSQNHEGFEQREPYVLQIQHNAYDSFYADIYEVLHPTSPIFMESFIKYIENETQPSKEKSTFLDIGCGSGEFIDEIAKRGYKVAGIDVSPNMIEYPFSKDEYKREYKIKCENVLTSPNIYEEDDFSHILCIGPTTLYEICSYSDHKENNTMKKRNNLQIQENLKRLVKNAQKWLRRGGYFIVQIEPLEDLPHSWIQEVGGKTTYHPFYKKITHPDMNHTQISFSDVEYTLSFTPPLPYFPSTNLLTTQEKVYYEDDHGIKPIEKEKSRCAQCAVVKETFINKTNNKVRENEWFLYSPFENTEDIVQYIIKQGFGLTKAMGVTHLAGKEPRIYCFQKV